MFTGNYIKYLTKKITADISLDVQQVLEILDSRDVSYRLLKNLYCINYETQNISVPNSPYISEDTAGINEIIFKTIRPFLSTRAVPLDIDNVLGSTRLSKVNYVICFVLHSLKSLIR